MPIDIRPTIQEPEDDPYIWLEEIENKEVLEWVNKQNKDTLKKLTDTAFENDRDSLVKIYNHPGKIPHIIRRGEFVYNFWQDSHNVKGVWRRTTLDDYRLQSLDWEVLINIDELAEKEKEDWVWRGVETLPENHDLSIIKLSRGGSDAVCLREFNLLTKSFVPDGFNLPEAKSDITWLDKDTILLCSPFGEGKATECGYSNTIRLWTRNEEIEKSKVIFEINPAHMGAWVDVDHTLGEEHILFTDSRGFFEGEHWVGDRSGPKVKIDIPDGAWFSLNKGWLIVRPRNDWAIGEKNYLADSILSISFENFLNGDRSFSILFTPQDRRHIQSFQWCATTLVLSILDNLAPVFEFWTPSGNEWQNIPAPEFPQIGVTGLSRLDSNQAESNGDIIITSQSPTTPTVFSLLTTDGNLETLRTAPEAFDSSDLEMSRHEATSIDGEKIPYVQIGRPQHNGNAPVLMNGYGGFGMPVYPHYNPTAGKLWLEPGGILVIANIRGGGEFGTSWHDTGRREGKALSHDDFAAIASDLVIRGVTTPARIAAHGGSNGGLLVANMLTRYPERFGAIFCTIPLLDMYRYTKLLAGASWIDEYGNPEKQEDWQFLQKISAYQQAVPGKNYPRILLATTRKDDRVHPGHARKMAQKLQTLGYPAHYYELDSGGHSYGKDSYEQAAFSALGYRFLKQAINWNT